MMPARYCGENKRKEGAARREDARKYYTYVENVIAGDDSESRVERGTIKE